METRANYILIGAFALAGAIGILAFLLWFARVELDRQFAYYDITFSSVSGLNNASDVRFSGLPVGRVVAVGLSPGGEGAISVRIEVGAETPIREDSVATIESQGVTGVAFVGITAGTPGAPLLRRGPEGGIPEIQSGRSILQSLSEDGPQLLSEMLLIVQEISNSLGGENRGRVDRILTNLEDASENFAQSLESFSDITGSISGFAEQIDAFNATLDELTGAITVVLATADTTLGSIGDLAEEGRVALYEGIETITNARDVIGVAQTYITDDLTTTTDTLRTTLEQMREQFNDVIIDARATLGTYRATGVAATARLSEAEATIAAADAVLARIDSTLSGIDEASAELNRFIAEDGTALVAEARVALAETTEAVRAINAAAQNDLPAIIADIRNATDIASRTVTDVGRDISQASGRIEGLISDAETSLSSVTTTFNNANTTLSAINSALDTGERALGAAERAFVGADRVINEDISAITDDLRTTLAELNGAIGLVAADIPTITADLRAASAAAESAFAEFQSVVVSAGAPVQAFAAGALPNFARLAQETRNLIDNLDQLTTQIQRDPARFFLNQQTPDFRRR